MFLQKERKKIKLGQVWYYTPIKSALSRLRQEDHEFKARVQARDCLKQKKNYGF
jgi:hypothetical protein